MLTFESEYLKKRDKYGGASVDGKGFGLNSSATGYYSGELL
jgi:hypothetical protein